MCGFIGILKAPLVVNELYDGLIAIQHRGQDAAGILTCDARGVFHSHKAGGLVRDIFQPEHVARLVGDLGIGHVRYPTVARAVPRTLSPS